MTIHIRLERIVEEVIKKYEDSEKKSVEIKDYDWREIREVQWDVERDEDDKKRLKTTEEVIQRLKKIEHLWDGLGRDFRELEKEIKKVLKA